MSEQLQPDTSEHNRPDSEYRIIVNGRKKVVEEEVLTFGQVLLLAFDPVPTGPNFVFTVTFKNAKAPEREGTLVEGQSVTIKNGTIFNVTATDKS